jgi:NADH dehydrogenase (ubiquinone) Fe-S protein 1
MKYQYYIDNNVFNCNPVNNDIPPSKPLIQHCLENGITIPHYCYHKDLSVAGNCRMCLIELEKSPKPVVSCAMSAKSCLTPNSKIFTKSPLVKKARENIMEFLLLNHPLDCPICDQGGECDLQDQSLFFGFTKKRFYKYKRFVENKDIGPIVKTVMTRCIHCTRCVRFASEIAGVDDLGMFGRGVNSEIGTYIDKIFQSELAGNVIDLCPVGALTPKPYPFIGRKWELKIINSIDFFDGFGLSIQGFLRNNGIVKILPGFDKKNNIKNWITDKTRFSFDGMFITDRKSSYQIKRPISQTSTTIHSTWNNLLKELIYFFYVLDHLNKHFLETKKLIITFGNNISIESLSLLKLIEKKYSFIKLTREKDFKASIDLESNYQVNTATNQALTTADMGLLINVNPRYEGSYLNLKLRQHYLNSNFQLFTLGSLIDLTYPTSYVGSNLKKLKSIVEGTNLICQNLIESKNLMAICNSDLYTRNDGLSVSSLLNVLKEHTKLQTKNWDGVNVLCTSINDAGINSLQHFEKIKEKDLKNSAGLYLIRVSDTTAQIKKLINIKIGCLINDIDNNSNNILITQNIKQNNGISNMFDNMYNKYNYMYLPTNHFFENSGNYLNTEGIIKKSVKLVSTSQNIKDDWRILRKVLSLSNNISFLSELQTNKKLNFNCNNIYYFKNFINFLFFADSNLTNIKFQNSQNKKTNSFSFDKSKFKYITGKIYNTPCKRFIDDFYINEFDSYSEVSPTMVKCSLELRSELITF